MQEAVVKKFGIGGIHLTLAKDSFNVGDRVRIYLDTEFISPVKGTPLTPLKEGTQGDLATKEDVQKLTEAVKKVLDFVLKAPQNRTSVNTEPIIPGNVVKTTPMLGENDLCCECGTPATRISINKMTGTERKLCPICN